MWPDLAVLLFLVSGRSFGYLSQSWAMIANERPNAPRCIPIPVNLTICKGIQYKEMRLPNLLEHESINEVVHQSQDWQSLLNLNCHPDTQLFLCSLFAPVCLAQMDKAIYPCRSLCEAVKGGCEGRMQQYGFPWPDMLRCSQYPTENDMCIKPIGATKIAGPSCESCSQVGTYENIVDHFCRSTLVLKARLGTVSAEHVKIRNGRSLKKGDKRRSVQETVIRFGSRGAPCPCDIAKTEDGSHNQRYLIMANKDEDGHYVANLILPWQGRDKAFKRAIHQFQRLNCKSIGREIRESASRRPHSYYMRTHNSKEW